METRRQLSSVSPNRSIFISFQLRDFSVSLVHRQSSNASALQAKGNLKILKQVPFTGIGRSPVLTMAGPRNASKLIDDPSRWHQTIPARGGIFSIIEPSLR
jgi:hypothetical protein